MEKARKVAISLICGVKYIPLEYVAGIWSTMVFHYNIEETEDNLRCLIEELENKHWNGVEPEWASVEAEKWWFGINLSYFSRVTDYRGTNLGWAVKLPSPLVN